MRRINQPLARLTLAVFIIGCSLILLAWPFLVVQAGPDLPSRDTPTPVSPAETGNADEGDGHEKPLGATIELQTEPPQAGLWSVVQWQDSAGAWQDVDGWQGTLDERGRRRWWVAAKDFGRGPFRWAVYRGQGGETLGISEPFYLPAGADEVVKVEVLVGQ